MGIKDDKPTGDWRDQRTAMEKAEIALKLKYPSGPPALKGNYDWDRIQAIIENHPSLASWSCQNCKVDLSVFTMIRCADCKVVYCDRCIYPHFEQSKGASGAKPS